MNPIRKFTPGAVIVARPSAVAHSVPPCSAAPPTQAVTITPAPTSAVASTQAASSTGTAVDTSRTDADHRRNGGATVAECVPRRAPLAALVATAVTTYVTSAGNFADQLPGACIFLTFEAEDSDEVNDKRIIAMLPINRKFRVRLPMLGFVSAGALVVAACNPVSSSTAPKPTAGSTVATPVATTVAAPVTAAKVPAASAKAPVTTVKGPPSSAASATSAKSSATTSAGAGTTVKGSAPAAVVKVNVNAATDAELSRIPGFTTQIIAAVKQARPIANIDAFRTALAKSFPPATVAVLEKYVSF